MTPQRRGWTARVQTQTAATASRTVHATLPGGYQVIGLLGQGAFARVYDGLSPQGEPVAIKILTRTNERPRKRFNREIKALRAMPRSPHVVRYIDHGTTERGAPFMVLERVDGVTLGDLLRTGNTFDAPQACEMILQMCDAFATLHTLGLTHGDIKPGNIMITRDGGTVKLLDFGMVRDAQGLLRLMETQAILGGNEFAENLDVGMIMGTPEYMAPEQIEDSKTTDTATWRTDTPSDVYGLGVMFYELLSGRRPFPFEPTADDQDEYWRQAVAYFNRRLATPDEAVPRIPCIDPVLWSVVAQALRRDPKRRPWDAHALGDRVMAYLRRGEGASTELDDPTLAIARDEIKEILHATHRQITLERVEADIPTIDLPREPPPKPASPAVLPAQPSSDLPLYLALVFAAAGALLVAAIALGLI